MNSLRQRLALAIVATIALVLAVAGWFALDAVARHLYKEFDAGLLARAKSIATYVELDEEGLHVEWLEKAEELAAAGERDATLFQVWDAAGTTLSLSPDLGERSLPRGAGSFDTPTAITSGPLGRAISVEFEALVDREDLGDDVVAPPITLTVARPDSVAPALAKLRTLFIGLWAGALLIGGLIVWGVVRITLRPLDQLCGQIHSLRDPGAENRIGLDGAPTELVPVVDELNDMLGRLDRALTRERNLSSNVAHELRTPIAGMLSTLEVMLSRPRSPEEYQRAGGESFEIAKQMHWLVNNLLSMSRIESGEVQLHREKIDLAPALREWWTPFASRATERDLKVNWELTQTAVVETDNEFLRVVMTNLFDNSVSYTPTGGAIAIQMGDDGAITITNDATETSPDTATRAFEPFWRSDEAREEVGVHAGLGMALCGKIVALLGGKIEARVPAPDRFEVSVRLT